MLEYYTNDYFGLTCDDKEFKFSFFPIHYARVVKMSEVPIMCSPPMVTVDIVERSLPRMFLNLKKSPTFSRNILVFSSILRFVQFIHFS